MDIPTPLGTRTFASVRGAWIAPVLALTLSACALQKPANVSNEAQLTPPTPSATALLQLPPPQKKIVAAVYGFRDETGQYKPSPSSAFSTAVTQGAASMLMKALKDSGWYIPVEREGLQSLLTERRVLRALAEGSQNGNNGVPNLLPASIILEGGVIAYDTNTRTGGLGAKFLGIGLSTQYSVDQVTVNLRAVDVTTGEVLDSVSTTKTIFSHEIHPSYFRFVNYYDLLEIEGGYTHNEPAQLAVKEAIDAAVMHLTINGIKNNLWRLRNPADWDSPLIQRYLAAEKNEVVTVTPRQAVDMDTEATPTQTQ
ncbi:CsgG/HfaB family protein [Castellaniella sp.]|jgi:curli production assembly/transport component CsgG|uniref:CsgG/HfaB family protein n=1 Tax=Castellaniella sp. TaxID=1955812 RepID=UPI002D7F4842|nr:CsgG/HfaB family protein [Castellaniella sp.]HET8704328.1 CsgG/HfaB family protein [Castellaniella sp.]